MARGSTRKPAPVGPPPLAVTDPATGVVRLMYRLAELGDLDPSKPNDPRFETVAQAIQSNVREIFGEDSPEDDAYWSLQIDTEGPFLLGGGFDDEDESSYGHDGAVARRSRDRREGIDRVKVIVESLIKRLEERAAERAQTQNAGVGHMASPWNALAEDRVSLVKPDGQTAATGVRAVVNPDNMLITRSAFPVEQGDTILREMDGGLPPERYTVLDANYVKMPAGASHWYLKVRKIGARPAIAPAPAPTHITNHYHVNQAAAVGHGAMANDNALVQHNNQQTLNVDLDIAALSADLAAIKRALLAQAADDDDDHEATEEAAKVSNAQKAIKTGQGVVSAVKALGSKTWALGERLALAYVNFKLRDQLGLPPGEP